MKCAVVLSGGGARGAYEIGVWQALNKLQISYDIVTGTSIGALNGALMATRDYNQARYLWEHISISDILKNGINLSYDLDELWNQKEKVQKFIKHTLLQQNDITPLKKLLENQVDEDKIKHSNIDFGIVITEFPSFHPKMYTKQEIKKGQLKDYLLASASCFPLFPICTIENKQFIDGGYSDNLPIALAIQMKATFIIAVDLEYKNPIHKEEQNKPYIHYIKPTWNLGPILNFEQQNIKHNIKLGYYDTLKSFHQLKGFHYTFDLQNNSKHALLFVQNLMQIENSIQLKKIPIQENLLTNLILEYTNKPLSIEDYFIRGCEIAMQLANYHPYKCYNTKKIITKLHTFFLTSEKTLKWKQSLSSKEKVQVFYQQLKKQETDFFHLIPLAKKEFCTALLLYSISYSSMI